jgi:putative ATP-dependent endonuclease of OLD family
MRKFHNRLVADPERVERLRQGFEEVVTIFHEVEEFKLFGEELRSMAGELAANLRYGLDLDFSAYDPSNYFRSLRVHPTHDGEVRSFDELGTGQEQILAVAFAYAYSRAYGAGENGLVLVIEEPEAHLHPLAQRWLANKIDLLGERGVQVIITTHSPAFVNLRYTDGLACVRKPSIDGATTLVQQTARSLAEHCRSHGASRGDAISVGPFYAASATEQHVGGLFTRACAVVEGPTESLAIPVLLSAVGSDPLELGISVVSAGGIGAIARWLRLYWAYGIPAIAIFDRDQRDDADWAKRAELLTTLGEDRRSYEELVGKGGAISIGRRYAVMSRDFEGAMRAAFPTIYASNEEAVRNELGAASKPLVAREACRRLALNRSLPGWTVVQELAEMVASLVRSA